ncbi:MAG TPA: GAF domain-containing protein [Ktedonobacteraceae bacterium]|nr:GAF domain-containing protein [Ktedonobacteraceae bacterium]
MMEESGKKELAWRQILDIATANPAERRRVALALDVSTVTITRWTHQATQPRMDSLRLLPDALPHYREELVVSLRKEYPHIFSETPSASSELIAPSEFYAQIISAYATSIPLQRKAMVHEEILQQLLFQLAAEGQNLSIFIAQFVPPRPGRKVRSLRVVTGKGNTPLTTAFEHQTFFFGTESQAGVAAATVHALVIQNQEMKQRTFPQQQSFGPGSTAALPIVQHNAIAGCLCFTSRQEDFFTPERLDFIQRYVNLLTISFEQDEFYEISTIELGVMPPPPMQRSILETLQQRITERLIQAMRTERQLNRTQAEREVLQEVEDELLRIALVPER